MMRRIALHIFVLATLAGCGGGDPQAITHTDATAGVTLSTDPLSDKYLALVENIDFEREAQELERMLPGDRALYVLYSVDGEINNGGFSQFLSNSTGSLFEQALAEAKRVGAHSATAVLSELPATLGLHTIPRDRGARQRLVEGLSEEQDAALARLDSRWFDEVGSEIADRLKKYYAEHPESFGSS